MNAGYGSQGGHSSIDPDLESMELSLLRLYRVTGAHSAAAEQYAHYAAFLRDELGVEPPPLASSEEDK